MIGEAMAADQVAIFLAERHGRPVHGLDRLSGGGWSSAWAYRSGTEELVARFGPDRSWYEADRMAMAFAGPDLPVPEVREVGRGPDGLAYAISVRHHGRFLEDTPIELAAALSPTLANLLMALRSVPAPAGCEVFWHQPGPVRPTWRQFLLNGLVDDPDQVASGWGPTLAADPKLAPLAEAVAARVRRLVDACPERRDLVHGDLLHGNVLLSPQADRVEAVFSWKCSVRGDFLFDAAWCSFWAPWHEGVAAADPLGKVLNDTAVRVDPDAFVDAPARHHCYELCIGFTHLGWNIWTDNPKELAATARRLGDVLERGPMRLGPRADARDNVPSTRFPSKA